MLVSPRYWALIATLQLLGLLAGPARAQQAEPPFSRLSLSASLVADVSRGRLTEFWNPSSGGQLAIESPFYLGLVQGGAHLSRFHAKSDVPDFTTLYLFLGWGMEARLPLGLAGYAGFDVGAFGMRFPRKGNANEIEMGVGLSARLRRSIGDGWAVSGSAGLRRTLTAEPLDQRILSVGLVRTFRSPGWARDILSGRAGGVTAPEDSGAHGDPAPAALAAVQRVLHRPEMQRAGLQRLSDIFHLLDRWGVSTIDGLAWQASPAGVSPFETQGWRVMVDGREVRLDLLGVRNLDRLPFTLAQVDSVQVLAGPGLHHGLATDQGLLHFHTAPPPRGVSVQSGIHGGNSTGDPGPFEFTDPDARNVDKLGSGTHVSVAYGTERFHARVGWSGLWYSVTDAAVWDRNIQMWDDPVKLRIPTVSINAPSLDLGLTTGRSWHRLSASGSRAVDLFFLPQYGREITTLEYLRHAAAWGGADLGRGRTLDYRLTYTENELKHHRTRLNLDFDWRLRQWKGQVELAGWGRHSGGTVGVGVERQVGRTGYDLSDERDLFVSAYAQAPIGVRFGAPVATAVFTLGDDGQLGARLGLARLWTMTGGRSARIALGYSKRLPEEEPGLWSWRERGYHFLEEGGIAVSQDGELRPRWQATLDVRLETLLGTHGRATLSGYLRRTGGLALAEQTFDFDGGNVPRSSPDLFLATDEGGNVAGAQLEVRADLPAGVALRSYFGFRATVGGDALFEQAWLAVPKHHFRQTVEYTPEADFALRAMLTYRGASTWAAYPTANPAGEATAPGVASTVTVDLSAQKWLWQRRVRTVMLVRDILDNDVGFHPIGGSPGRSLLIQADFFLGRRGSGGRHASSGSATEK